MKVFVYFLASILLLVASLSPVISDCPKECPSIPWMQVCGTDINGISLSFPSECALEIEQCENPSKGWTLTKTGFC